MSNYTDQVQSLFSAYKAQNDIAVNNLMKAVMGLDQTGVPVPTPPVYDYTKTIRYGLATNAYKMSLQPKGIITTIQPAKGGVPLNYEGATNPTLGMPYITKDGLLFLQNQYNTYYMAYISDKPQYPLEMWYVLDKPDYFMFEKYTEEPLYAGDMGAALGLRTLPDAISAHLFAKAIMPVNKFSIHRFRLTETPVGVANVEYWVDGTKQTSSVAISTYYRNHFIIGVGVNTNNSYVGWAEAFSTPILTDTQASQITAELQAEYKPLNLPYATGITYTVSGSNLTASCSGIPTGGTAKIRWVNMPSGPESSVYMPQYDGKWTIPVPGNCRAEITVYDAQGAYFDIPSTKYFQR